MYNSETPSRAELPSSRQLLRSTTIAAISAIVLLTTVVLPSEYGIDPTGAGRVLGLTEMGEIKTRLATEALADTATASMGNVTDAPVAVANAQSAPLAATVAAAPVPATEKAAETTTWRHEMSFTLAPGVGTEVKLRMNEGDKAFYDWVVEGGAVNYDTHGDGSGRFISYVKGRGVPEDKGELMAAFTGNHGWYWRNRGRADVKVTLRTRGAYSDIQRMK